MLTDTDYIRQYPEDVRVGFGYRGGSTPPHEFTNYAFSLAGDVLVAAWLDFPGLELEGFQRDTIEVLVPKVDAVYGVRTIDYISGEATRLDEYKIRNGDLWVDVAVTGGPVRYVRVNQ